MSSGLFDDGSSLPEPPVPPDADLRHFHEMPIDVVRLFQSELAIMGDPADNWYALTLWGKAWHQVPAGSLPTGDLYLQRLAGITNPRTWKRHREGAMRGWKLHSDGRLYHSVLTEKVLAALRLSRAGKAAAKGRWGSKKEAENIDSDGIQREFPVTQPEFDAKFDRTESQASSQPIEKPQNGECDRNAQTGPDQTRYKKERIDTPLPPQKSPQTQATLLPGAPVIPLPDPIKQAVAAWNEMAVGVAGISRVIEISEMRRRKLRARLGECGGIDGWCDLVARIPAQPFLCGAGDRGWVITFDWLLEPRNLLKVREDTYRERKSTGPDRHSKLGWIAERRAAMAAALAPEFDGPTIDPKGEFQWPN